MLAPLSWIKEFVDVSVSPEALAEKLSMAGLEVEALQSQGAQWDQIFTAKILKMSKHPNADKLTLCEVQCGEEVVAVVCGAKNMKEGDIVALARPGAVLPNGLKIKASKIRGESSQGMLCSESELGLVTESSGILILPEETLSGSPLAEALGGNETVLEVNVTPNRGDCLSIVGLAREVAANYGLEFKSIETETKVFDSLLSNEKPEFPVELMAEAGCLRYSAVLMRGIKVGPSPKKIIQRLEACGIRSINNVVDATNYLMLQTGQPLHAFDLAKLKGGIEVRWAQPGEKIVTLEGQECPLEAKDLIIADHQGPVALAGVMGGEGSGVNEQTTDLLLESACFDPSTVRKTAHRLGIATDSSYRFERGVDPNACVSVLGQLALQIQQVAGGEMLGPLVDRYPAPKKPQQITLRVSRLEKILGTSIEEKEIISPLKALGIDLQVSSSSQSQRVYSFEIPTFRSDLTREIDVIEEVARLYGYDKIPTHYPRLNLQEMPTTAPSSFDRLAELRKLLSAWGFTETIHYSFTSPKLLNSFQLETENISQLSNPLSEELSILRPALFPQMLETLHQNLNHGAKHLKLFELRPVYTRKDSNKKETSEGQQGLKESWQLCLALAGTRRPEHFLEKDEKNSEPVWQSLNLMDLKGYVSALWEYLRRQVGLKGRLIERSSEHSGFHPGQQLAWQLMQGKHAGVDLGFAGLVHPKIALQWGLAVPAVLAEIKLDNFLTESKNRIQFQEISPFPGVGRDLNLIVEEKTSHRALKELMKREGGPWLQNVLLYDLYRGKPLPEGKKALTYRLEYGAKERTLTDEEVNQAREKLLAKLNEELGASLR